MPHEHVCPWWIGYLLASPLRRIFQKPENVFGPYVKEGTRILEIGPGMGFFSIPMAKKIGPTGKIFAVDLQDKMLSELFKRAKRAGVETIIECRRAESNFLKINDISATIDFTLAFAVVHEVPDIPHLFEEVFQALKPGGLMLMADPASRFPKTDFKAALSSAKKAGFTIVNSPDIWRSISVVLKKP